MTYEKEISRLRNDMFRMERDLQDDINSLTMKNSILRSLLEAINHHEGGDNSRRSNNIDAQPSAGTGVTMNSDDANTDSAVAQLDTDSLISRHISRLPHEIQVSFLYSFMVYGLCCAIVKSTYF